jgi:hypothetical protein
LPTAIGQHAMLAFTPASSGEPKRTTSSAVITAATPLAARAPLASIARIIACGCGERSTAACSVPGDTGMSSM